MKKIFLILLLYMITILSYAQKSYVSIYFNLNEPTSNWVSARLSGDIPPGMKNHYAATYDKLTDGEIINMLSQHGYIIDKITGIGETCSMIIMSKNINNDLGVITNIVSNDNLDKLEICRYNLQGYLISEDEPGIQIIVYSDYSAKVVVNK